MDNFVFSTHTLDVVVRIDVFCIGVDLVICLKRDSKEQEQESSDIGLGRVRGEILCDCLRDCPGAPEGIENMLHHLGSIRSVPVAAAWSTAEVKLEGVVECLLWKWINSDSC